MAQSSQLGQQPDQTGLQFRASYNLDVRALATMHSGPTPPPVTYDCMLWVNTTDGSVNIRSAANNAWHKIADWDGAGGYIPHRAGKALTAASTRRDRLDATAPPGPTDDATAGYEAGSLWLDTTSGIMYICRSAAQSNAVWLRVSYVAPSAADIAQRRLAAADGTYLRAPEIVLDSTTLDVTDARIASSAVTRVILRGGVAATANANVAMRLGIGGVLRSGSGDYTYQRRDERSGDAVLFGSTSADRISLTAAAVSNVGDRRRLAGEITIWQSGVSVLVSWRLSYWDHGTQAVRIVTGSGSGHFDGPVDRVSFAGLGLASADVTYICRGDI